MNKSKSQNPRELIDRYLQAVRFWLPKTQMDEDLIAELGEDLHSQVEATESELGHALDQEAVAAILKRCGNPMFVAGSMGPKRYLIGPALFPIYKFVSRLVLVWILVPVFLFIVGPANFANRSNWGMALLSTLLDLASGMFVAAGIITLVFAVLERTQKQIGTESKWDPRTLPPIVPKREQKISLPQLVAQLIFGYLALAWLLLLPHYPALILGPAAAFLKPAPMMHQFYLPVVLLTIATVVRPGIMIARPQWTWFPLSSQVVITVFSLVVLNPVISAASQTPNGQWQGFLVLADSVPHTAHYLGVAAIINASIAISLAIWWLVLCISGIVQAWQLFQYVRRHKTHPHQPASIPTQ